jgi:type II secretory pathway component PulF
MSAHPETFNHFYISLVEVGEESGTLVNNLEFLAHQLSKEYTLQKKIKGALMYPALIFSATAVMGIFISLYILPKLVDFFKSFDIDLPWTTKLLIGFADIMGKYGIIIFVSLALLVVLLSLIFRHPKVKPFWHTLILRIPLFGKIIHYSQLAHFSRNFGTLIKSGVPIVHALEITANTLSNVRFKLDLLEVSKALNKGQNIADSMKQGKYFEFPPIVYRMIAIGEKTGRLDETLLYLGDFYEEEVDDISKNLSTILEPALLIVMGLIVGFVALSIISPIYQLTGSIHR